MSVSALSWRWTQRSGRRALLCIGDSHLKAIDLLVSRGDLPGTDFRVLRVGGATASGVNGPNSRSGANRVFLMGLSHLPAGSSVLISLGEIDAGYLAFWKHQNREIDMTVEQHMLDSADRFQDFILREIIGRGLRPLVLSSIYPTIESYVDWPGMVGARESVTATRSERARITHTWNQTMKARCDLIGAVWLDMGPATMNGLDVRPEFLNPDGNDHHYALEPHADVVLALLKECGFS